MRLIGSTLRSAVTHSRFVGRNGLVGEKLDVCLADSPIRWVDDDRAIHLAQFTQARGSEFHVQIEAARTQLLEFRRKAEDDQSARVGALNAFEALSQRSSGRDVLQCAAQECGI